MQNQNKNKNLTIDYIKLLAIYLVICIHCYSNLSIFMKTFSLCAVPFFFIASGYFLKNITLEKLKHRINYIFKLVLISNLLYFIFRCIQTLLGFNIDWNGIISLKSLLNFFILNNSPFAGHLWFLSAMLYSLIYIYMYIYQNEKYFLFNKYLILILITFGLILGRYSVLLFHYNYNFLYTRNFLFEGIPLLLIGNYIYHNQDKILSINENYINASLFVVTLLAILERFLFVYYNVDANGWCYITTIFLSILIFFYAIKKTIFKHTKFLSIFNNLNISKICLYIYIVHVLFIDIFSFIFKHSILYYKMKSIFVFLISLIVSIMICLIEKHIKN